MRYNYVPGSIVATDAAVARDVLPPPPQPRWRILQSSTPVQLDDDRVPSAARMFVVELAGVFKLKSSGSCRLCKRWLEGEWSAARRKAERDALQRQMDAGRCDACAARRVARLTWSMAETVDGEEQTTALVVHVLDNAGVVMAYAAWHDGRSAGAVADTADGPRRFGLRELTRLLLGEPEPPPPTPRPEPLKLPCRFACGKVVRYKDDLFTPYKHDCTPAGQAGKESAR